jgi:DNA-binding NarL/FixJ family response regulator
VNRAPSAAPARGTGEQRRTGTTIARVSIRVIIAEDSLLVREGIATLLAGEPDIEVAGLCADFDELMASVASDEPDVIVTDIRMPPTGTDEGIRAANELRREYPRLGVVVLSQFIDATYAVALFDAGSEGRAYLLKERVSDPAELAGAVRSVASGGSVIDPKVVEVLVTTRSRPSASPLRFLTPRELEVLGEIARGKNNAAVAAALRLSERAVEKHINSLFAKLGLTDEPEVHRRVTAVLLYLAERPAPSPAED